MSFPGESSPEMRTEGWLNRFCGWGLLYLFIALIVGLPVYAVLS